MDFELSVEGYKSIFSRKTLKFTPITVMAGANSAGKSSFFQPMLLIKQTLEAPYDPGVFLLEGANVRIRNFDDILAHRKKKNEKKDHLSLEIKQNGALHRLSYGKRNGELSILEQVVFDDSEYLSGLRLERGMSAKEIDEQMPEHLRNFKKAVFAKGTSRAALGDMDWVVTRNKCFLGVAVGNRNFVDHGFVTSPVGMLARFFERIIHLPGLRGNPERDYKTTAVGKTYPGMFQEYTASIINDWKERGKSTQLERLGADLQELGLTWKVSAKRISDTQVSLFVGRMPAAVHAGAQDLVNVADVGLGVSQVLPVLVSLMIAEKGQLVYLEQPEIHLHPKAQFSLAKALVRAAKRGVIVVIETHSSLLLRGIQTAVVDGDLPSSEVSINWFSRNAITGDTEISSNILDEFGRIGSAPDDFDHVYMGAEKGYLDSIDKRVIHAK